MGQKEKVEALEERLYKAEEALEQVVKAFNKQVGIIRDAFTINDRHVLVQRMVLQDLLHSRVLQWPPSEGLLSQHLASLEHGHALADVSACLEVFLRAGPPSEESIFFEWYYEQYNLLMRAIELFRYMAAVANKETEDGTGTKH